MDRTSPLCRELAVWWLTPILTFGMVPLGVAHAEESEASPVETPSTETERTFFPELAAEATYTTVPIRGGTTPFGLGFGGRLGLVFHRIYVGANAIGYLGGMDIDISDHAILYGLELGYDVAFDAGPGRFIVRPQVGIGGVRIYHTDPSLARSIGPDVVSSASGRRSSSNSGTTTLDNVYVQPGMTFIYAPGMPFAAVNANALVLPGINYSGVMTTWLSYGLQGQVGLRF
jgi:hypothetical protein